MKGNEASWDRIARVILGVALIAGGLAYFGGAVGWIVAAVGLVLVVTGFVGFCPIYGMLRTGTLRESKEEVAA